MPNKPRVPIPSSPREVEEWRIRLADGIGNSMAKVPSAGDGNLPIFDNEGQVEDSGESIDTLRARSYFYAGMY